MRLRSSRWSASVWALGLAAMAATAIAQPPAAPPTDAAYPADALNYSFDESGNLFDELELSSQFRFQADWVYFTRQNRSQSIPLFNGSESVNQRDATFNYQSGYRLNLGFMNEDYELEGSYMKLDGPSSSLNGTLTNSVVFDGAGGFAAASPAAQATIGATPNFLESNTLFAPMNASANHASAVPADNETNELEFLDSGATYKSHYSSSLQDFDVNLKGRRQSGRLLRFGFGYRNIQFNEGGSAAMRGSFNTVDSDGNEAPGFNDPNDGLSNAALTGVPGAGLTLGSGAGGLFENALPTAADQLLFTSASSTTNQLNGVQATLDATFLESEYFSIGGYAKAGVFHNRANGSITETYQSLNNGLSKYSRSFSSTQDRVAFAGNLGINATVNFRDNMRLFGGYELMYLSGVALAPDQSNGIQTNLANVTSLGLQSHGQALYHGARIGFEILFP